MRTLFNNLNMFFQLGDRCPSKVVELNEESGQITSPGYPMQYENFLNCMYRITVGPNDRIKIDFEDFETEEEYDWVELFDGDSTDATSLGKFSGRLNRQSMNTSSNQLFVKFVSDEGVSLRGFKLSYSTLKDEGKKIIFILVIMFKLL